MAFHRSIARETEAWRGEGKRRKSDVDIEDESRPHRDAQARSADSASTAWPRETCAAIAKPVAGCGQTTAGVDDPGGVSGLVCVCVCVCVGVRACVRAFVSCGLATGAALMQENLEQTHRPRPMRSGPGMRTSEREPQGEREEEQRGRECESRARPKERRRRRHRCTFGVCTVAARPTIV